MSQGSAPCLARGRRLEQIRKRGDSIVSGSCRRKGQDGPSPIVQRLGWASAGRQQGRGTHRLGAHAAQHPQGAQHTPTPALVSGLLCTWKTGLRKMNTRPPLHPSAGTGARPARGAQGLPTEKRELQPQATRPGSQALPLTARGIEGPHLPFHYSLPATASKRSFLPRE